LKGMLVFEAEENDLLVITTPGGGGWGRITG
jgi:N-methylhydantoinase B/oxoprolinase/acetone carboxylase alpha subunit